MHLAPGWSSSPPPHLDSHNFTSVNQNDTFQASAALFVMPALYPGLPVDAIDLDRTARAVLEPGFTAQGQQLRDRIAIANNSAPTAITVRAKIVCQQAENDQKKP